MSVHTLPAALADPRATCDLTYIRRRLGRQGWGDRRTCTLVQQLVDHRQFPAPFPSTQGKARELTDAVTGNSTWLRAAVDQWFDGYLTPAAGAALDAAAMAQAAQDMDARAGQLGALKLVGGRA